MVNARDGRREVAFPPPRPLRYPKASGGRGDVRDTNVFAEIPQEKRYRHRMPGIKKSWSHLKG